MCVAVQRKGREAVVYLVYTGTSNKPYPACPKIGECAAVVEGGQEGRWCRAKGQPVVCSGISPATTATLLYLRLYPHLRL